MENGVLTVSNSERNVVDTVGSNEAVHRRLLSLGNVQENPGWHRSG